MPSLSDRLAETAARKLRAAQVRFLGNRPGAETPREVFLDACATIGEHLRESFGFKYAKSGPHCRKRSGDFTFEVSFQSDRNNVAGERIGLWIHGNVRSPRLEKWRAEQPFLQPYDGVAGGQIGNLRADHRWLDWELAIPENRDRIIREAIESIEELALTYFARFEDLSALIPLLIARDFPAMDIPVVLEFLMCFADAEAARSAAVNFLNRHAEIGPAYAKAFAEYAVVGLSDARPSGWAERLAFASHAFRFGDLMRQPPTASVRCDIPLV